MSTNQIHGVTCPGYGIASKGSLKTQELVSNLYPGTKVIVDQTVYRQFPFFIKAGVTGIEHMYPGTINVDVSPQRFVVKNPDYKVTCEWIEGIEETFLLTEVQLIFSGHEYKGYLYVPSISGERESRRSMMEIITERIDGITYEKSIAIQYASNKISLI